MTSKPKKVQWDTLNEEACQEAFAALVYYWMCQYVKRSKNKDSTKAPYLSLLYSRKVYLLYYSLQEQIKAYSRYVGYHDSTVNSCFYSGITGNINRSTAALLLIRSNPEIKTWLNQLPQAFSMHATYTF